MKQFRFTLSLFDGEAAPPAAAPAEEREKTAEKNATGGSRREKQTGEATRVLYGRQEPPAEQEHAQQEAPPAAGEKETAKERQAQFRELIGGKYKDLFTRETQRIIDGRFHETKNLESRLSELEPVIASLSQRYGIEDGDAAKLSQAIENDDAYWTEAAENAGMSVEQFKTVQKLQSQNANLLHAQQMAEQRRAAQEQVRKWSEEAEGLKGSAEAPGEYPQLDLMAEIENPQFLKLLKSGIPVKTAYEAAHLEDIKGALAASTAKNTEKKVVSNIAAKGTRPNENGAASAAGILYKNDVHKLNKADRKEIARRVLAGEHIVF